MESILDYINKGGFFIYPIFIGTICALTLLIERTLFFKSQESKRNRLKNEFFSLLAQNNIEQAENYLQRQKGTLKEILFAGISNIHQPVDRIEEKMEIVIINEMPHYRKYLNFISALAGIMPILGLLGTVTGMIATFKVIALQGTGDAQAMADGISEALITTQAGLAAALPIILGHVFLSSRARKSSEEIRAICTSLLDYIKDHRNAR